MAGAVNATVAVVVPVAVAVPIVGAPGAFAPVVSIVTVLLPPLVIPPPISHAMLLPS